jgi:hypothetical protein
MHFFEQFYGIQTFEKTLQGLNPRFVIFIFRWYGNQLSLVGRVRKETD